MFYNYPETHANSAPNNPCPPEPRDLVLARAYIPNQEFGKTFPPNEALHQGTLFPELVRPYTKKRH